MLQERGDGRKGGARHTDLHHEACKAPGVVVEDDATDVSQRDDEAAGYHAAHEPPGTPSDAEIGVDHGGDGEEGDEGAVGCQRGPVAVHAHLDGAEVEGTVGSGTEDNEVAGHSTRRGRTAARHFTRRWLLRLSHA